MNTRPTPRQAVPPLQVPLLGGGRYDLARTAPDRFSLIVFYRGHHCPTCCAYLASLARLRDEFARRGVQVIAISADSLERATHTREEWRLAELPIGYGLPIETGRHWGLYVSSSQARLRAPIEDPPIFTEPGLYLVEPDGLLHAGVVMTMPFALPRVEDLISALDLIGRNHPPARGEA